MILPTHSPATSSDEARPPPMRVGDHLALDFLNTVGAPKGTLVEWIGNGRDLLDWLSRAGVLTPSDADRIMVAVHATDLDKIARDAIDLREWFRGVVARIKENGLRTLTAEDITRLNGELARDASVQTIVAAAGNDRPHVVRIHSWRDPSELLAPIAEAMADLICEGDFDLVRKCENPPCTMWFYDRTKGHRRRWCSTTVCGNRAKVAAFRLRKRHKL
jgi:predicted RNA-binding Zn ribbon-like protein